MDLTTFLNTLNDQDERKLVELVQKFLTQLSDQDKKDLSRILQGFLGDGSTPVDPGPVIPPVEEPENFNKLTDYRYEASSEAEHAGEYYVMPPAFMKGQVESVSVGSESYRYVMEWSDSELWYGQQGSGRVTVILKDGAVYKSAEVYSKSSTGPAGGSKKYHHISDGAQEDNMFANRTIIVLCHGQTYDSCYTANEVLVHHNQLDRGRHLFYAKGVLPAGTIVTCVKGDTETNIVIPGAGLHFGSCTETAPTPEPPAGATENGDYQGRLADHNRPYWYWSKNMKDYPATFYMTIPGCKDRFLVNNNGTRVEIGGYHGWIIKQSDVQNRNRMAMIGPVSCTKTTAYIEL